MALKSTIYKAELQVNDMDRHRYDSHNLTLARHPSETDERMMVRLLAFALHADESLAFGKGLSSDDEPDLWRKDLTGAIELWIDVGLPDSKLVRRACGRAAHVVLYSYGKTAEAWWKSNRDDLARFDHLAVYRLSSPTTTALAALAQRSMSLQCSIEDGATMMSSDEGSVDIEITELKSATLPLRSAHR